MEGRGRARNATTEPRLFEPAELRLRRTGAARLLEIARRPMPPPSAREKRSDEDRTAIDMLRALSAELAPRFGLRACTIDAEREGVVAHYGICYSDGTIRIRLRHATTGRLLKESSLVDTLCHELAHLRHFDHSPRFRRFYLKILEEARRRGHYRPGPDPARARQISLFDAGACGTV